MARSDIQLDAQARAEAEALYERYMRTVEYGFGADAPQSAAVLGVDAGYVAQRIAPALRRAPLVLVLKGGALSSDEATCQVKEALHKALEALGYAVEDIEFMRVGAEAAPEHTARQHLAAAAIEAADPEAVIAIDEAAWELLGEDPTAKDTQTFAKEVRGRRYLYIGNFEAALSDGRQKQKSWSLLKLLKRENQIY